MILLPATLTDQASPLLDRLRDGVASGLAEQGLTPCVPTLSGGVSTFLPEDEGPESVLVRADLALYRAKDAGRDQIVYG